MIQSNIVFCYDRLSDSGIGYPNLSQIGYSWKEWDCVWPNTVKLRLIKFFIDNKIDFSETTVDNTPDKSWYPIGFSWFDFNCDYISLIPKKTIKKIQNRKFKILFYYHEADNPYRIKSRIDALINKHSLPQDCYIFISANTAANNIKNFIYFNDHESFFANINQKQSSNIILNKKRMYDFVLFSRTHKWWRGTCVYDLHKNHYLENSIWSYHSDIDIGDSLEDNPIDLSEIQMEKTDLLNFVNSGPYIYDNNNDHNSHRFINLTPLQKSHINLILETHFDVDQSDGAFLTEKTFKPIKFGQPFVIIGPANSLSLLRSLGYKTFDHAIDNSYDKIIDNTERWKAIKNTIKKIKQKSAEKIFEECYSDIVHNQHHFTNRIKENLNYIVKKINCKQ